MDVLDLRQLNRATLARQCLLERSRDEVASVVRRCGGIQAQGPSQMMTGLWSRIAGFDKKRVTEGAIARELVRGTTLRGTLHLHDAATYRALRMSGANAPFGTLIRSATKPALIGGVAAAAAGVGLVALAPEQVDNGLKGAAYGAVMGGLSFATNGLSSIGQPVNRTVPSALRVLAGPIMLGAGIGAVVGMVGSVGIGPMNRADETARGGGAKRERGGGPRADR